MNPKLLAKTIEDEPRNSTAHSNKLTQIIDDALKNRQFSMVYQPLISTQDSSLIGFEALCRCQSPIFGFISPDEFIQHAEASGQIIDLGNWVFQQSLLDLRRLKQHGFDNIRMSINVSPVQLFSGNIFEDFMSLLMQLGIPPEHVKLELTETAMVRKPEQAILIFEAFQREGVQIWVDDFGTGFASLSLLQKYKIDGLKIDRSFVDHIALNNDDFTLVSAVIAMAQRLGLHIIAEGVETDTQLQILNQLGCEAVQGYLLGRPARIEKIIKQWSKP